MSTLIWDSVKKPVLGGMRKVSVVVSRADAKFSVVYCSRDVSSRAAAKFFCCAVVFGMLQVFC